jgi:hypothetical protein
MEIIIALTAIAVIKTLYSSLTTGTARPSRQHAGVYESVSFRTRKQQAVARAVDRMGWIR